MRDNSNISRIILKQLFNLLTKGDQQSLHDWINKSDRNLKLYNDIIDKEKIIDNINTYSVVNLKRSWGDLKYRIKIEKRRRQVIRILSYAAILVLLFCVGVVYNETGNIGDTTNQGQNISKAGSISKTKIRKIVVPEGEVRISYLPDGTQVYLNAGSTIEFPVAFVDAKREVKVSGEAYFIVAHNSKKPFIVHSELVDVVATGTQFNFKAFPDNKKVETTLIEGGVDLLYGKNKKRKLTMKPNQKAEIYNEKRPIVLRKINSDTYEFWFKRE